ncbi:MAG: DUF1302 domain-containing protein [Opitutaceae bacterium]|nr:DUF1302 domain-containing protein [Opitutaceae bacterium]
MNRPASSRVAAGLGGRALATLAALSLLAPSARAFTFTLGEVKASFDSTVSLGGLYRLKDPEADYYGTSSTFKGVAGLQNSVNADDGNLNYGKGWASQILKGNHDLELKWRDFGALARGYWFKDWKADDTRRTALSDQAKDRVASGAELLDLYARAKFTVGAGMPLEVRIGRQVLSLGESTFIPNGINVVNSADLSKLRTPGAELKEALLPVNMIKASLGVAPNVTVEPFMLLEFRRNELEPAGSYFSTNDFATRGGSNVWLGFGSIADQGSAIGAISREKDRDAGNFGQYGLATRFLVERLNNTEFGLYYARYHSRSPVISARTPTVAIDTNLTGPLTAAFIRGGVPAAQAGPQAAAIFQLIVRSSLAPASLTPVELATLNSAPVQAAIAGARQIALLTAAASGRYFTEYAEGLNLFGLSFNTSLGKTGISWQGEVSLKNDVPLQVDDVELLFAALSSLAPQFGSNNQLGNYLGRFGAEISGYRRHRVWTAQSTMTKVFGPMFGSQQFTVLGEVGGVWANLPSKSTLRYDGPATFTGGSQAAMNGAGFPQFPATASNAFPGKFSWGYQFLGRLDYNNVLPNVNMQPSLAFSHDVGGVTPLPLGNYIKGRRSVNLAVEFTFRNAWSLEARYVNFFGAGRYNLLGDRDYFATTAKFSF